MIALKIVFVLGAALFALGIGTKVIGNLYAQFRWDRTILRLVILTMVGSVVLVTIQVIQYWIL